MGKLAKAVEKFHGLSSVFCRSYLIVNAILCISIAFSLFQSSIAQVVEGVVSVQEGQEAVEEVRSVMSSIGDIELAERAEIANHLVTLILSQYEEDLSSQEQVQSRIIVRNLISEMIRPLIDIDLEQESDYENLTITVALVLSQIEWDGDEVEAAYNRLEELYGLAMDSNPADNQSAAVYDAAIAHVSNGLISALQLASEPQQQTADGQEMASIILDCVGGYDHPNSCSEADLDGWFVLPENSRHRLIAVFESGLSRLRASLYEAMIGGDKPGSVLQLDNPRTQTNLEIALERFEYIRETFSEILQENRLEESETDAISYYGAPWELRNDVSYYALLSRALHGLSTGSTGLSITDLSSEIRRYSVSFPRVTGRAIDHVYLGYLPGFGDIDRGAIQLVGAGEEIRAFPIVGSQYLHPVAVACELENTAQDSESSESLVPISDIIRALQTPSSNDYRVYLIAASSANTIAAYLREWLPILNELSQEIEEHRDDLLNADFPFECYDEPISDREQEVRAILDEQDTVISEVIRITWENAAGYIGVYFGGWLDRGTSLDLIDVARQLQSEDGMVHFPTDMYPSRRDPSERRFPVLRTF